MNEEFFALVTLRGPNEQGPHTVILHDEDEENLSRRINDFDRILGVRRFKAIQTEFWFEEDSDDRGPPRVY